MKTTRKLKTVIAALFEQRTALRKACNRGPYADRLFEEYLRAEQAIADVPTDCLDDLILKLEVAREEGSACTIYEDVLESVYRDLVRMAAAKRAAQNAPVMLVRAA